MRKLSIVIPTWERVDMTLESFSEVYSDERVSDIVIIDDASSLGTFNELKKYCEFLPKVSLGRNLTNQDCNMNKYVCVSLCPTEYCVLLDSDNRIGIDYLDKIFEQEWDAKTVLAPSFAAPNFDYRNYSGLTVDKNNVSEYIDKPMFEVALNTANYFINKNFWLSCFDTETNPVTSDSIYQAYNILNNGGKIKIVDGLTYQHTVHVGSHYQNNSHKTPTGFHESVLEKIRNFKSEVVV